MSRQSQTRQKLNTHMPYTPEGERTNRCSAHKNKVIYSSSEAVISVILRTQEEFGIKLVWYKCDTYDGYHLCKFENKH